MSGPKKRLRQCPQDAKGGHAVFVRRCLFMSLTCCQKCCQNIFCSTSRVHCFTTLEGCADTLKDSVVRQARVSTLESYIY
eukprot:2450132-Amphidinium_carterae.1